MPPMIDVSRETLESRRREILDGLEISDYAEYRRRRDLGLLTDAEWARLDDLEAISFLLEE